MAEANAAEPLRLWGCSGVQGRMVLGAHVGQACPGTRELAESLSVYGDEAFAITYRCARPGSKSGDLSEGQMTSPRHQYQDCDVLGWQIPTSPLNPCIVTPGT